jgi:hypothetical protein
VFVSQQYLTEQIENKRGAATIRIAGAGNALLSVAASTSTCADQ